MFIGWFGNVIGENQQGVYGLDVDRSFRMGMMWFIFSEVMFFAAFFGALFYARSLSVPWLGGEGTKVIGNELLHPLFENAWPTNGPSTPRPERDDGTLRDHPGVRPAGAQHHHPAAVGRHGDHRAPCAARRQSRRAQRLPRRDVPARLPVRLPAGDGISPRLHRARPARSAPASTARRSSCSPASTVST